MAARKKSLIWSFFSIAEDTKYAIFIDCKQKISRGGSKTKTFNTSNLVSHLKSKHIEDFRKFKALQVSSTATTEKPSTSKQITLQEASDQVRVWDINDPQAFKIHRKVGEMICLDSQPFSIVDNHGFTGLLQALEP